MTSESMLYGVELGASAVRICALSVDDGVPRLELYDQRDTPRALGLRAKLRLVGEMLREHDVSSGQLALALPADEEFLYPVKSTGGPFTREELSAQLFDDLVDAPEHMYFDATRTGTANDIDAIAIAGRKLTIDHIIDELDNSPLDLVLLDGPRLAACNATTTFGHDANTGKQLIIDIGASSSRVTLVREGGYAGSSIVASGGDAITEYLASSLDLDAETAETYKIGGSDHQPEGMIPRDIHEALDVACKKLATRITASIPRDWKSPSQIQCTGRTTELAMMRDALSVSLGGAWRRLRPFDRMHINQDLFSPRFLDRMNSGAAVATGLALRLEAIA